MKDLGLYFHIPFCNSKCFYCDFDSNIAKYEEKKNYVDKIIKEIKIARKLYNLDDYNIDTIFIGGGTPTSLDDDLLDKLLKNIENNFNLKKDIEFSIEINPNSINSEKIEIIRKSKINRISIGLQSTNLKELKALGRTHSYDDFEKTYNTLRDYGFDNINIDLMIGIPYQNFESYNQNLKKIIALNPKHISAYMLIIEENTPFQKLYDEGKFQLDDSLSLKLYEHTVEMLQKNGYIQYEISNFAKPNYECKHNIKYWKIEDYLGFGQSAHSLFKGKRFSNFSKEYNDYLNKNELPIENIQEHSKKDKYEESIFLKLRMNSGIDIDELDLEFNMNFKEKYNDKLKTMYEKGYIENYEKYLRLTLKGMEISNQLFLDFI